MEHNFTPHSYGLLDMQNFCNGESILDPNLLWNSPIPRFNRCFQHTLPVWLPSAILWLLAPWQVYLMLKSVNTRPISCNLFNMSRLALVLVIILLNAFKFGYYLFDRKVLEPSLAQLSSSLLNVLSYVLFAYLLHLHRLYGRHTSGLAWLFTFLSTLSSLPTLYMYSMFGAEDKGLKLDLLELVHFGLKFACLIALFLLTCFADKRPLQQSDLSESSSFLIKSSSSNLTSKENLGGSLPQQEEECPILSCSFLSNLTFSWFTPIAVKGYRKVLTLKDLWKLVPEDSTRAIAPKFDQHWSRAKSCDESFTNYGSFECTEQNYAVDQLMNSPNVLTTLARTFKYHLMLAGMAEFCISTLGFVCPQLLKLLIAFVSSSITEPQWHGYTIAACLFIISSLITFSRTFVDRTSFTLRMRARTALISTIYRKALTLSNSVRSETTTGEIVNYMSTDAENIGMLFFELNTIWSAPLVLVLAIAFLWVELGVAMLAGMGVLLLLLPFNAWLLNCEERFQKKMMEAKDERVKVIAEVLSGVRVIKLYGWEMPFISKITQIRAEEVRQIKKVTYLNATSSMVWMVAPYLVSLASFATYVLMSDKNILTPQKAFVSLALFGSLRFPMGHIPWLVSQIIQAWVSAKRVNKYLNSSQLEKYVTREESGNAVEIQDGSFTWDSVKKNDDHDMKDDSQSVPNGSDGTKTTLSGINLSVKKGSLVAIVGHVGSGKSSLLSAILGDMERMSGRVNISKSESIAFVAQQAWIQNATLRDNILFGLPYIQTRFDSVMEMCALKPDLAILPGGDQTEIGEKGINLSGGQKQRVAIARACYSYASTVLLDDPLSAVDSHVGQHIFTEVISNRTGYLRDRTRILVTNQISFLHEVDQIIVLSDARISEIGTYDQLISNQGKFSDFIAEHSEKKFHKQVSVNGEEILVESDDQKTSEMENKEKPKFAKQQSSSGGQLIEEESMEKGGVKLSVYGTYFRSWTWPILLMTLFGFISNKSAQIGSDYWLALWANDVDASTNQTVETDLTLTQNERLLGYGLFAVAQIFLVLFGTFGIAQGNVNSSIKLHRSLLDRIMRSPMHFFDTTPLGRIVNRFSRDIDTVDTDLAHIFDNLLACILNVVATLTLICVKIPVFVLVILPIGIVYFFIQRFYIATYRQLSRLQSVTKSPIFSHFAESLSGVNTIRAYGHCQLFVDESNGRVDTFQRCFFSSWNLNRWLCLRLEFCGNLVVLFAAIFAVLWHQSLSPGFVGLIVTYTLDTTDSLNWLVRMASAIESSLVSVERIDEYCNNETEREWTRKENKNPELTKGWPHKGDIEFSNFSLRYREGLDLVLNGIDLKVQAGEKIGIVGRTGAGKSSLTLALFRIVESAGGSIRMDGVQTDRIGLHELRAALSIIPQDPVLFSGSIRSNLDPFGLYTDEQLWQALEHSHLKQYIASQEAGLNHMVAENGSNLSLGQRQLICLARALLRHTPILVLDEATAAIDLQTDALIQQTIRHEFAHCTVLTIAHRLNTIIDSTRVLVLDQGRVAEFDTPANLLANRNSKFYSLAKDAKIV